MHIWVVFAPLLGALLTGIFRPRLTDRGAAFITCSFMVLASFLAIVLCLDAFANPGRVTTTEILPWIQSGAFQSSWTLRFDMLSILMIGVVTIVSTVVHFYATGYMHGDPSVPRFMAYLSLFTFFMLILVTANNLLQLFVGWEGVGLCSYLLIGFWFQKPAPNAAAIKAFLVNRVGDIAFILGLIALFSLFKTIQFDEIFNSVALFKDVNITFLGHDFHGLTLVCVLLFMGAMGKSAQIGLHTWLPDAMEGPTPVSALIHAATMVTAGVFLVCRMSPLFEFSETALAMVTIVGAITALFAATIGLVQNDIKRVIAYSTCSQLGYMFFAAGVSAYAASMFHLITHAFFKALLFLCAGSVIHAFGGEQDMRKMGGVYKKIPTTYIFMLIGTLALTGFPFLSGFYSKDLILESAFAAKTGLGEMAYYFGCFAAVLTSLYSFRLVFMAFHGETRASKEVFAHVHESPKSMILPLVILVFGALFAGFGLHHYMLEGTAFWGSTIFVADNHQALANAHHVPFWVKAIPFSAFFVGLFLAYIFYMQKPAWPGVLAQKTGGLYRFLLNKWYFDELYEVLFVTPFKKLATFFWQKGDVKGIDALGPGGAQGVTVWASLRAKAFQSGYVYHYAFVMFVGLIFALSWLLYLYLGQ